MHSEIDLHSWFNNVDVERTIRYFLSQRAPLCNMVGVFPVFSKSALLHLAQTHTQTNINHTLAVNKKIENNLLEWYLESMVEAREGLLGVAYKNCKQVIIPLLIQEHYSVAVVNLVTNESKKIAQIQYYNSFGVPLDDWYQIQLKHFFKKYGYMVRYRCVSRWDQQDTYNCGLFVSLKAIEIANQNAGIDEPLLLAGLAQEDYSQHFYHYRYQLAMQFIESGYPVSMSGSLQAVGGTS